MNKWALPGPAGFVEAVLDALRDGANVVVGAPLNVSVALCHVLEDRVAEDWRVLGPVKPSGKAPLDDLFEALELVGEAPTRRSIASLMQSIDPSRVIVVTDLREPHWNFWARFIEDYANASRSVGPMDRSQLLVVAAGVPQSQLLKNAPALHSAIWDGVVGEVDVFGFVIRTWVRRGKRVDAYMKLLARIITRLALWDIDLAERLLEIDSRTLFDPTEALLAAKAEATTYWPTEPSWEKGGWALFDGEPMEHSMVLADRADPNRELQMRLWAAQAAELLPILEIHRRRLAHRMKETRLRLPVEVNGELVHDLLEVEIGPLMHISRSQRLPPDIVRLAEKYWRLRNKLAHLEPLDADEATDPELLFKPSR